MCGSGKEALVRAEIEGSLLVVCPACARFGKVLGRVRQPEPPKAKPTAAVVQAKPEAQEAVVPQYAQLIRNAREKSGLTQKDFAKKVNEKESILAKFETGKMEPPLETARKLEKILKIKLVEQHTEEELQMIKGMKGKSPGGLTIGDVLKL